MLPQDNLLVKILILLNVLILIFTYPLTVNPANTILESVTVNRWCKKKRQGGKRDEEDEHDPGEYESWTLYSVKNISRLFICVSAAYLGIELHDKLDKFIGLLGALFCAPLAIMTPALCHLKVVAKTRSQKCVDIFIFALSVLTTIFCIE